MWEAPFTGGGPQWCSRAMKRRLREISRQTAALAGHAGRGIR